MNILVCLDGTRFAEQILPYVIEEARHSASKVVLLQVIEMPRVFYASCVPIQPIISIPPALREEQIGAEETTAKAYLNSVALRLRERGLDVDCVTVIARPGAVAGDIINSYAATHAMDLIAMATRAYTGWKRLIFGSTANSVFKKSGLPVLSVKLRNGRAVTSMTVFKPREAKQKETAVS